MSKRGGSIQVTWIRESTMRPEVSTAKLTYFLLPPTLMSGALYNNINVLRCSQQSLLNDQHQSCQSALITRHLWLRRLNVCIILPHAIPHSILFYFYPHQLPKHVKSLRPKHISWPPSVTHHHYVQDIMSWHSTNVSLMVYFNSCAFICFLKDQSANRENTPRRSKRFEKPVNIKSTSSKSLDLPQ